jgi:hypothetical protein
MHYRSYRWLVTLVFLLILTAGCAVKLVYNQLDWLIPWYISDYVSFSGDQRSLVEQRVADHLAWHRNEQLPRYADLLDRIAKDLESGLDEQAIARYQQEVEQITRTIIERVAPDVIALFVEASDEQLEQLFAKFAEDNANYRKKYVEKSERQVRQERADDVIKGVQRWIGRLSRDQRALVNAWSKTYPLMTKEFLDTRMVWQQALKEALQLRNQPDQFAQRINQLINTEGYGRSREFEHKLEQNQILLTALYGDIQRSLSQRQRERAIATMRGYARDFRELAAR